MLHPTLKGTRAEASAVGPAAAAVYPSPSSVNLAPTARAGMPIATQQHSATASAKAGQSWMLAGQPQQRLLQEQHQQQELHRQQHQSGLAQPWCMSEAGWKLSSSAADLSDGPGLRFGNSITFQHVGGVSPTSAHADAESAPGQDPQRYSSYVALSVRTHITLFCGLHLPLR